MIKLCDFGFSYSDKEVFQDVDLHINLDNPVIITGENGSGKTTLARILCGLQKGYVGNMYIFEKELKEYSQFKLIRNLLYIKQESQKNFVAANLNEDLQIWQSGFSKTDMMDATNIRKGIFEQWQLSEVAENLIWQLSGGQLKRGSLAPLQMYKNKLWILDEPAASLDSKAIEILIQIIKEKMAKCIILTNQVSVFRNLNPEIYSITDKKIIFSS